MSSSAADAPSQQRQGAVDQEQPPSRSHHQQQQQHRPPPQEPPLPVMERVLFQLHQRTCQYGLTYLSGTTRQFLEHCILVIAVGAFGAWLLLHRQFMYSPSHDNAATQCLSSIEGFDPSMDVHRIQILRPPPSFRIGDDSAEQISRVILSKTQDNFTSCAVEDDTDHRKATAITFSISTTKGFLQLPLNHSLFQDGVLSSQTVVLAPHDDKCFGEPFLQFLIHNLVGYETIVWNWALGQQVIQQQQDNIEETPRKVFVWSHAKGRLQELDIPPQPSGITSQPTKNDESSDVAAFFSFLNLARPRLSLISKLSVVIKTSFLFLFSTTLVSFTLRETQERMLEFTQELSRRVSIQLPLVDLIVFHLIHNLVFVPIMVGMMFFLIEFYSGDRLLAFLVMSIVWCVEVFSVISLRSYQGITFFPRAFFLLFSLFHIYYFANPYGFAYTAIGVVGLFMLHSMAFFWHRYELPAVASGRVNIDRPRLHYDDHRGGVEDDGVEESASPPSWISSSRGTGRAGHSGMNRHEEPLLQPESPPQIRPSPRPPDFSALGEGQYESSSAGRSTRPSQPWSAVPQIPLPRQNSASSRNNSVNSSSYNVYGDGDDEDSSSYVYFMQGEVVLHRNHRQQSHVATPSSISNPAAIFNVESAHTLASTTSAQDLRQYPGSNQQAPPEGGGGFSSHIGLDLTSTDHDALQSNTTAASASATTTDTSTPHPDTIIYSSPPTSNEPRTTNSVEDVPNDSTQPNYSGDDSKGGLQSILEVRLTPRHRNMGRGDQGHNSSPAPIFPNLPP